MRESDRPTDRLLSRAWYQGIATELALAIAFSIIVALLVALAGAAMVVQPERLPLPVMLPPADDELLDDFDPRDPLVICTIFVDHTSCAREPT